MQSTKKVFLVSRYKYWYHLILWLLCLTLHPLGIHLSYAQWIGANQISTRIKLEYVSDQKIIKKPITTWPLPWQPTIADLANCGEAIETIKYQYICQQLLIDYQQSQIPLQGYAMFRFGNEHPLFTNFGQFERSRNHSEISLKIHTARIGGHLNISNVNHSIDNDHIIFDGSYLSYFGHHWSIGAGAIERWWGPSWSQSLILSTNARPIPSIFLTRNHTQAFETHWLNWLGPWHLVTFMGVLEHNRSIDRPLFWGLRITFKPSDHWEFGLSRTAIWGGTGRPNDLDTFIDLFLGNNEDFNGTDRNNTSDEPGNQLGGFDFRYGNAFGTVSYSIYGQIIGEDEAGGLPSKQMALVGASLNQQNQNYPWMIFLELADTSLDVFKSESIYNTAYEHGLYSSGYRYQGRTIGSTYDNDSITTTTGLWFQLSHHEEIWATLSYLKLNRDSNTTTNNPAATSKQNTTVAKIKYTQTIASFTWGVSLRHLTHLPDNLLSSDQKTAFWGHFSFKF